MAVMATSPMLTREDLDALPEDGLRHELIQVLRQSIVAPAQINSRQRGLGLRASGPHRHAIQFPRQGHVFTGGRGGDQIQVLEHEPQVAPTQHGQLRGSLSPGGLTCDAYCTARGQIQTACEIEQRRLAGPAGPHHGDQLPRANRQGHITQGDDLDRPCCVDALTPIGAMSAAFYVPHATWIFKT